MSGWSAKSARLVGGWVVRVAKDGMGGRGAGGMWPVGWWSGTRMKECEGCVKI